MVFSQFDLRGFHWTGTRLKNKLSKCSEMQDFQTYLSALVNLRLGIESDISQVISSCRMAMPLERAAIFGLVIKRPGNINELKKYLQSKKIPNQKIQWVVNIWQKKKKVQQEKIALYELFSESIKFFKEDKKINLNEMKLKIDKISQVPNSLNKHLVTALIALKIGNQAWANNSLENILYMDPRKVIFDAPSWQGKDDKYSVYLNSLYYFFEHTLKELENKTLAKLIVNYFGSIIAGPKMNDIIAGWGSQWSLFEMRKMAASMSYGRQFIGAWVMMLSKRVNDLEVHQYITRGLDPNILHYDSENFLWIFQRLSHLSDELKAYFEKLIIENKKNKDDYFQYILINLMQNEVLSRIVMKNIPGFKKAQFQLKRNFYLKLLYNGVATDFAIYNLLQLGDRNEEYLWWLAI